MRTPDPLVDAELTLRRHRPEDIDGVLEQCQDEQMQRWTTVPVPYQRSDAEAWVTETTARGWEEGSTAAFAIDVAGRFAGTVDLRLLPGAAAEIGYGLAPWARGRGVMSRAVRLALGWGFGELGLLVVHWQAFVGNWPSRRVAWACGFRVEGSVRGLCLARGLRHDAWIGSICQGDAMRPTTRWLDPVALSGRRAGLRAWHTADLARLVEAARDPLNRQWLPGLPSASPDAAAAFLAEQAERMAEGSGMSWALHAAGAPDCLGAVTLRMDPADPGGAEIGYLAHPEGRGRGLVAEGVWLAARHALLPAEEGGLGLHRVVARIAEGNTASRAVVERVGFRPGGRDRSAEPAADGGWRDMLRFDLLAEELGPLD